MVYIHLNGGYFWDDSMAYLGREEAKVAEALLKEAGFAVSQICCSRPSCFDLVVRKNANTIFIKVQPDVDNFSPNDSNELQNISESVFATSVLISDKARENPLEDDTVYSRYNIPAITLKTFENIVVHKIFPLIQASPGGYYVEIDGAAIRHRRQELGLSAGEMAKLIGISRRTLYGYERGMTKASVAAAYNMIYTLGIPIAKPVKVLEKPGRPFKRCILAKAKLAIGKNKALMKVFRKFERYNVTTVRKAPFDFVITIPDEKMKIIGGVADDKDKKLDQRVDEILSISQIVQAYPILVTDKRKLSNKAISCVCKEELSQIRDPEDLLLNAT